MARPEERYIKLETKTLSNGKIVYKSSIPLSVTTTDDDQTVVASEQDRMDIIAQNVYGDAQDWWKIAAANNVTNGSLHVPPGKTLIIPKG